MAEHKLRLVIKCKAKYTRSVGRVSGIPEGVGAEEGQLAAILDHAADFAHLEPVTQLGENTFVP